MKKVFVLYFLLVSCASSHKIYRSIGSYQHSTVALEVKGLYFNPTVQKNLKQWHERDPDTKASVKKVICEKLEVSDCNISVSTENNFKTDNFRAIFITNNNTGTNTVYSLVTGKSLQVKFSQYRSMSVYDLENSDESIMLVLFTFESNGSNTGFIVRDTSTEQYIAVKGSRKNPSIALRGDDNNMSYLWNNETLINREKVKANKYEELVADGLGDSKLAKALLSFKGKGITFIKIKPPTLPIDSSK